MHSGGRGGRGRGRGGREAAPTDRGRGRGARGGRQGEEAKEEDVKPVPEKQAKEGTLAALKTPEQKLALMFGFLHKYLNDKYKAEAFED